MKIRLSDEDRERLGAPEELDCSLASLPVREAEALEDATGIEPLDAIRLMSPKSEPHPTDPGLIRIRLTPKGARLLVWLGLHRAGVSVPFDELTFDYLDFAGWSVRASEPAGKAERSPESEPSTASKSARSGRRTSSKTSAK